MTPLDHIADGVSKVITQYAKKPVFLKYLAVYLHQIQLVEDACVAVFEAFQLDTATGFRLEWIGRKVGQERVGSTNDVFRRFIRGRIAANRSRGSTADVIRVARAVLDTFRYTQMSTTINVYSFDALDAETAAAVQSLLEAAAGPGITVWLTHSPLHTFEWTQDGAPATIFGFSQTDDATALPVAPPTYFARVAADT